MALHDPALIEAFDKNRADIRSALQHDRQTCPCTDCADQRWQDARDDEFDARWNARMGS